MSSTTEAIDTRSRLIEATIAEMSNKRHSEVRFNDICSNLGVPASLVQYYFGGRNGLITESTVVAYERYVQGNIDAAKTAKRNPESRLRAWIWAQYEWTIAHPGIAALLNFGVFSGQVDDEVSEAQLERFARAGRRNMAVLGQLVSDLRRGVVSEGISSTVGEDATDATMTALVAWTTLGFSTWAAGRHLPTRVLAGLASEKNAIQAVVDKLIDDVRAS